MLGLGWDLCSSSWHTGSVAAACELLVVACGIWFPDQGLNLGHLHWEQAVLTTGPPGKSPEKQSKTTCFDS